jgi:hypothetical protein
MRVASSLYKRLCFLDECHRRSVSARGRFASGPYEPKFDMRPSSQRVIAKTKLCLAGSQEVIAAFQITSRQRELGFGIQYRQPHLATLRRPAS